MWHINLFDLEYSIDQEKKLENMILCRKETIVILNNFYP